MKESINRSTNANAPPPTQTFLISIAFTPGQNPLHNTKANMSGGRGRPKGTTKSPEERLADHNAGLEKEKNRKKQKDQAQ